MDYLKNSTIHKVLLAWFMLVSVFLLGGLSDNALAAVPRVWTARNAVVFALENSPDSRIAEQRIAAAAASRQLAESAYYPRVNLSATYGQTNNPIYSFGNILNQGSFDNTIDFNNPGRTDNLNMKAEMLYRFYNGGRDKAGIDAANSTYLSRENDRRATMVRLGFEVIHVFQTIVQAEDQRNARQAELEAIEASLAVAVARYEAGDLLKAEMLNFEVQQARASENLIISKHKLELAQKNFLNLLGLKEGSTQIDPKTDVNQDIPQPGNYGERPELTALSAQLSAVKAELVQEKGSRYPTLDGFANYQYDQGYVVDGSGDSWTAGLRLNYNLYDGKLSSAGIARKKAEYAELKELLAKLELAVNLEIQEAELNLSQAFERRSVTEKMVQVAQESALLSRERFKEGVILSSDLIETEVRLTDALVRQSAARANQSIAIANLRRAVGLQQFTITTEDLLEN